MFRILFIAFIVFFINLNLNVYAVNIVYPKSDNVKINSDKTFFIGNEDPALNLKINNQPVKIHPSGGFKHTVYLNHGENKFVISNGKDQKVYKIYRPFITPNVQKDKRMIVYKTPIIVQTSQDSNPLRSTPVDSGLNRLQHLQKGINLFVIGEYCDFYKVKLDRDDIAWINKNNVTKVDNNSLIYGIIAKNEYKNDKNSEIFTFKLNEKVPYVLNEEGLSGYTLTLYNMDSQLYPFGRYEFPIAHQGKNFGYTAYYNENNELVVKISKYVNSLKGLRITLDAGHGESENGAIGCLGDKEKDINLQIAKILKKKLEKAGAVVFMTREDDKNLGLYERVDLSNKNNSQIFISIHNNALPDSMADKDASGTEVYYFYPQSRYLAKVMALALSNELGIKNRGAKGGSFAVIRNSESLAILIEVAFMINPDENAKLRTVDFQNKVAQGVLKGLEKYFSGIDMEIVRNK